MPKSRRASPWRSGPAGRALGATVAAAACLVLLLAGSAHAAPPPANACAASPVTASLVANATRLGVIDLQFFGAGGAPVTFFECAGDRALNLGQRSSTPGTMTSMWSATSWRCARLTRRFAAVATLPGGAVARGTGSIHTRSCAGRFALTVPRTLVPGRVAHVRIADRWRVGGVRTKLCIAPPGGRPSCRRVVFPGSVNLATRDVRLAKRGIWRVELRVAGATTRVPIAVGVRGAPRTAPPPTLLATGDSTMDGIDSFLSDDLGASASVVSDVQPGLAISKSEAWLPTVAKQVARVKPATTVVSIGANEGWPMRAADGALHECCDAAWVDEYARRVRAAMTTYGRRVFWLTVAAPREARRVPIFAAVDTAVVQAAQGLADVHLVRLDLLFTPNGYRDVIRDHGREVRVREPDGVHLNVAGARIAAREVVKAIRAADR